MPTFVFRRPVDVPFDSSIPTELLTAEEPQETPTVIDPMFLPPERRAALQAVKPGDVAQALLKARFLPTEAIEDGGGASPVKGQGFDDATTIATENSPDSRARN